LLRAQDVTAWVHVALLLVSATLAAPASAQPPAMPAPGPPVDQAPCTTSFIRLAPWLTIGDRLIIVGPGGAESDGSLVTLSEAVLTLDVQGNRRDFTPADVTGASRLSRNTGRGSRIGLGIGVGVAVALGTIAKADEQGLVLLSGLFGGIGSAAGAGIGSASSRRIDIYTPACVAGSSAVSRNVRLLTRQPRPPASTASAGQVALAKPRPDRRWEASFVMGTTSSGPARDLERAMRAHGFDESRGSCVIFGFCFPGTNHPFSRTGIGEIGFPWLLTGRRWLSPRVGIGLSGGVSDIGATFGQQRDTGEYFTLEYTARVVAPMLIVRPLRGIHTGVGPAFVSYRLARTAPGGPVPAGPAGPGRFDTRTQRRAGFMWELDIALPPRSRVFGELLVQYRHVGQIETGPFTITNLFPRAPSTFPSVGVDGSHWFVGVGSGIRF
jgi:hypothetical protein